MNYKIVSDSSANLSVLDEISFESVPLHIIVGDNDFIDNSNVDINNMNEALASYKGKSSTSSPSSQEWVDAFGDAEVVFCITITSGLSGSFASAKAAASMYESKYSNRKVFVIDSLSTGPEMVLIIRKLAELIKAGNDPETIYNMILEYQKKTHLYFSLSSLDNFAKNGRISSILAKGIGILGIKIVGKASDAGTLEPLDKCRGDKRAYNCVINHLKSCGYNNGQIVISHTNNPDGAEELKNLIANALGITDLTVMENRALCSYYAEPGSVLIGFEA